MQASDVAEAVLAGRAALFVDRWQDLLAVRKELNARTGAEGAGAGAAAAHRAQQAARREAGRRLLVAADAGGGRLALRGGPAHVGYLQAFYDKADRQLVLRANDISAMHVAWQYYLNGVQYPFLEHPLHPFFGVYFAPTPHEHLLQLDDWLSQHPDALSSRDARALDLGTGSGVISFLLRRRRPALEIVASDLSPNAIFSVTNELERWSMSGIEAVESDLFSAPAAQGPFDVIIFNPPWVPRPPELDSDASAPGRVIAGNDYPPGLFARLLAAAPAALRPGGRLLILFSDYAQSRGLVDASPLQEAYEAAVGGLHLAGISRRPVPPSKRAAHRQTRRDKSWALAQDYSVELWELERR